MELIESLIGFATSPWPYLGTVALFGFAPGLVLRVFLLLYPPGHARRREIAAELYKINRIWRPFYVAEQMETALFDGVSARRAAKAAARQDATEAVGRWVSLDDGRKVFIAGRPRRRPRILRWRPTRLGGG
ncbi:MAG: hypothetical protein L0K86_05210 [Actinomycetia bacterium]|nr:hypothetical protein [Actinomycetes bacterium]